MLWKNGEKTVLASEGRAEVVRTDGEKIYVGGRNNGSAVIWVDGVPRTLNTPNVLAPEVYSLFINNGTIYASGQVYKSGARFIPVYWENESMIELPGSAYAEANDICFFKGDVIAVGGTWRENYIWKNGYVAEYTSARFYSIKIFEDKCYMVGYEGDKVVVSIDGVKTYYDTPISTDYNRAQGYGIYVLKE